MPCQASCVVSQMPREKRAQDNDNEVRIINGHDTANPLTDACHPLSGRKTRGRSLQIRNASEEAAAESNRLCRE